MCFYIIPRTKLGKKDFISFYIVREESQGRNSSRGHGGARLAGLLSLLSYTEPLPRVGITRSGWAFHVNCYEDNIKKPGL